MLGAAAVASLGSQLPAQDEGQPAVRPEARKAEREADDEAPAAAGATRRDSKSSGQNDALLATCLLIDNQVEATLAEFAQKRAESDDVRQFAEKMAQEHSQAAESLKRMAMAGNEAAPDKRADSPRADDARADDAATPAKPVEPRTAAREDGGNAANPQATFFVTLKREMGEQCLQSAQKDLGAKKGEDFDKCYIRSQVMAHQHMLDGLTVMERHAGKELKQAIAQAKETTQTHLEEAKAIAMKFEGKPGAKDAARVE
jgi:predicted outer membrane protein